MITRLICVGGVNALVWIDDVNFEITGVALEGATMICGEDCILNLSELVAPHIAQAFQDLDSQLRNHS